MRCIILLNHLGRMRHPQKLKPVGRVKFESSCLSGSKKKCAKKTCWSGSNLTKAREALMKLLIPPVAKLWDLGFVWEILRPPQPKSRWFFFVWGTVKWVATQFFINFLWKQIMWASGEDWLTLCKDPWDDWYLPANFPQKSTKCT